jgi:hypothetical protein
MSDQPVKVLRWVLDVNAVWPGAAIEDAVCLPSRCEPEALATILTRDIRCTDPRRQKLWI